MERLYKHIKNVFDDVIEEMGVKDKFKDKISYQRYVEDVPNSVGIILLDSREDEESLSGETEWECMKLELHIVCENNEKSIFGIMGVIRRFVDDFEKCLCPIEDGIDIVWAHHLGAKAKPSYTNGYGLQICKCTIDFNYKFIFDEEV